MAFLVVVIQRMKLWKGLEKNPAKSIGAFIESIWDAVSIYDPAGGAT